MNSRGDQDVLSRSPPEPTVLRVDRSGVSLTHQPNVNSFQEVFQPPAELSAGLPHTGTLTAEVNSNLTC